MVLLLLWCTELAEISYVLLLCFPCSWPKYKPPISVFDADFVLSELWMRGGGEVAPVVAS